MVNDLLDLAKVEAGKTEIMPTIFKVNDLFSSLRGIMRPLVMNPLVKLIFDEPVNIPPLHTDEGKVSQILRNLISNALKFTEQGEVRVSATLTHDGQAVLFSVSDTGIGISSEDQKHIFDEFIQVKGSLQERFKGTGLGLPLSKKFAELLGGNISVKSELGVGSTFYASIPLVYHSEVAVDRSNSPITSS